MFKINHPIIKNRLWFAGYYWANSAIPSQYKRFIDDFIWEHGWHKNNHMPSSLEKNLQYARTGDFIALKYSSKKGTIVKAVGVISNIEICRKKFRVKWLKVDMNLKLDKIYLRTLEPSTSEDEKRVLDVL